MKRTTITTDSSHFPDYVLFCGKLHNPIRQRHDQEERGRGRLLRGPVVQGVSVDVQIFAHVQEGRGNRGLCGATAATGAKPEPWITRINKNPLGQVPASDFK